MIGPIGFVKGYLFHRKCERFRQAMALCGEEKVAQMNDEELVNDLFRMVREQAEAEIRRGGRVMTPREIKQGVVRLLESATFAAETRAAEMRGEGKLHT